MVKVKICGNRTLDDVRITQGADAQGFIVGVPRSPRNLEPQVARRLIEKVGPFNTAVLVTTVSDPERLAALVEEARPDVLQLHTGLSPVELHRIRERVPQSVQMCALLAVQNGSAGGLIAWARALSRAPLDALLLDTRIDGRSGGTGVAHDWTLSRAVREAVEPFPVILAGGLTPENVRGAIEAVRPYAVDVSSGVEENGAKSPRRVEELLKEVRRFGRAPSGDEAQG